ncbi:hypothetical protein, partial [Enterobacter intestinihominis]
RHAALEGGNGGPRAGFPFAGVGDRLAETEHNPCSNTHHVIVASKHIYGEDTPVPLYHHV